MWWDSETSMKAQIHYAIISHNRPENVKKMEELTDIGEKLHWYVGKDEKKSYKDAIGEVIEGGNLCESRNKALQLANSEDKSCLMLDDDLVKIEMFTSLGKRELSFANMVHEMRVVLDGSPLCLAGTATTGNRYFFHPERPYGYKHFIGGWCTLSKFPIDIFYDEKLKTKEDYDITLQHIAKYGGVIRLNYLVPTFLHWNNKGGVVDTRTDAVERKSIAYLKKKWKESVYINKKRGDTEILLRIK